MLRAREGHHCYRYSFRDYDALASILKARQVNEDLKLLVLSPHAYDIRKVFDGDDEWFLWTEPIYGYIGNTESEAKYLPEIDQWLARLLKSGQDKTSSATPA